MYACVVGQLRSASPIVLRGMNQFPPIELIAVLSVALLPSWRKNEPRLRDRVGPGPSFPFALAVSSRHESIKRRCTFLKVVAGTDVDEVMSVVVIEVEDEQRVPDNTAGLLRGKVHPNFAASSPTKRNRSCITLWARQKAGVGSCDPQCGNVFRYAAHETIFALNREGCFCQLPHYGRLATKLRFRKGGRADDGARSRRL